MCETRPVRCPPVCCLRSFFSYFITLHSANTILSFSCLTYQLYDISFIYDMESRKPFLCIDKIHIIIPRQEKMRIYKGKTEIKKILFLYLTIS